MIELPIDVGRYIGDWFSFGGLVFCWRLPITVQFLRRIAKVSSFLLGNKLFFWRLAFHSTMKGNLITGPNIPIMRSLASFIKTWHREILEDMQQMIGEHHTFPSAQIEYCDSYGTR